MALFSQDECDDRVLKANPTLQYMKTEWLLDLH